MPQIRIWIILFLLLTAFISQAQDEDETQGWDIIERCVGEATEPPDDWTYDGTILATGWAGIHGINADWETPHVLIFDNHASGIPDGLSPDNQWFAAIQYDIIQGSMRSYVSTYALQIYNTVDRNEIISIPLAQGGQDTQTFWINNEQVVYRDYQQFRVFNLRTGESNEYYGYMADRIYLSHSFEYILAISGNFPSDWEIINTQTQETTVSFRKYVTTSAAWSPNDQYIAFYSNDARSDDEIANSNTSLVLMDAYGNVTDTIITRHQTDYTHQFAFYAHGWSSDSRYYVFLPYTSEDFSGTLHIADLAERRVIDTCIISRGDRLAWSPKENIFIYMESEPRYGNRAINVFDIENWQTYTVSYHRGQIIGWREDPE